MFVSGRISAEEEKASKLILEKIVPFETVRRQLSKLGGTGFCWESLDIFVEPNLI